MLEILFQNSFITVRTLNILLAIGFLFTGTFVIRYVNKHKLNLAFLTEHFLPITLFSLFAGRLTYVLSRLAEFRPNLISVTYLWDLKISFFGLLGGAFLGLFIAAKRKKEDFWSWLDALVLSMLAMLFFVHIGYFFAGKEYGIPTTLPWGIAFDTNNIPFITPLHPTQLYAALITLLLLAYSVKKRRRIHLSGVVGSRALMIYSLVMLGMDFLHGTPSLYVKISYGVLAALSFIAHVHCSHKTHDIS